MATQSSGHGTQHPRDVHVVMINLARGADQLDRLSFEPVKPSFLLAVMRQ
jgi:hypothetical protein